MRCTAAARGGESQALAIIYAHQIKHARIRYRSCKFSRIRPSSSEAGASAPKKPALQRRFFCHDFWRNRRGFRAPLLAPRRVASSSLVLLGTPDDAAKIRQAAAAAGTHTHRRAAAAARRRVFVPMTTLSCCVAAVRSAAAPFGRARFFGPGGGSTTCYSAPGRFFPFSLERAVVQQAGQGEIPLQLRTALSCGLQLRYTSEFGLNARSLLLLRLRRRRSSDEMSAANARGSRDPPPRVIVSSEAFKSR